MNAQVTRSIAIALALTIGAASASTAFAARGSSSGPSGPSSSGPAGGPSHTSNPIVPLMDAEVNCNAGIRCIPPIPRKPIVRAHLNCDSRVHRDGHVYKDCRNEGMDD